METITNNNQQTYNAAPTTTGEVEAENSMFSLREILDMVLYNWRWFVLSVVLSIAFSRLYLATKPKIYQRQAVMLVKDDAGGGSRRSSSIDPNALMALNGVMSGSTVKNEVYILRSHLLLMEVAKQLKLDVLYDHAKSLQNVSLYDNKPFEVQFQETDLTKVSSFYVTVLNKNEARVYKMSVQGGEKNDFDKVVRFGQSVESPAGTFTLVPNPEYIKPYVDEDIIVSHLDLDRAANIIGSRLSTGEIDKMSTLVSLVYQDTNIKRAEDILNELLEAYKRSIIDDKNRLAQSTADFIDERIKLISSELGQVETSMANFKQSNNLVDISSNAQAFLQQSSTARQRTVNLQAQQATIKYLIDHIKNHSQGNALIPTLGGVADAGVQAQIANYNALMLQRNKLVETAGENAASIREMDTNLAQMKQTIITSMQGYAASVDLQVRQAQNEERDLQGVISRVPQKEKKMIDIQRQQAIKETLYTYLLNKREETALQLAISEANIRIVEYPFGSQAPIAPRSSTIMLIALAIGLALPFGIIYALSMLNMGVRGRRDIEQFTTIPIIGEIPHISGFDESKIVVSEKSNDTVSEAFRLLRFNLNFVDKNARVIMFTSTIASEGKTFVSRNFAQTLALAGKKVVLMDTDIRKRTQSALYHATNKEGLTSYLNSSVTDFRQLIIPGRDGYHVDVLPAGVRPPNPAELLMSNRFDQLIGELREVYDYIVIDNVPAQVVADAGIVNRVAELTIYVMRDRKIDRRYLPDLERLHKENKFNNMTILLNDILTEKKGYGYGYSYYGYGYSYGYRYGYGYGYGMDNDKKK